MKKILLITMLALLALTQAMAQDYEYVPFVREGVKWECYYGENYNPMYDPPSKLDYFYLEFKGDTIINGKTYKLMHKYHGNSINTVNDTIAVCMREEDKVVYAVVPDGKYYCPIGNIYKESDFDAIREGREFVLYDFKNPIAYWSNFADSLMMNFDFVGADILTVGKHRVKAYSLLVGYLAGVNVIEGIGLEATNSYPLAFFWPEGLSDGHTVVGFKHLIEDGEIIYTWRDYDNEYPDWYKHEYVPFVREGVKWVYYYDNPFIEVPGLTEGIQYYSFEMKGDVLIGDKYYKPVILSHYTPDGELIQEDYIPVYLREEDKVVYAIHPDGLQYPQCPVGIGWFMDKPSGEPWSTSSEEFILYDFNDPITLYDSVFSNSIIGIPPLYLGTDYLRFDKYNSKRHHYNSYFSDNDVIIEGIGYDGNAGMPFFYFETFITGLQVNYALSHVIENGEIIYKGIHYKPDAPEEVDEVVADQRRVMDDNYYDLMGRAVGKDVPSTPGIYIHNGNKICVSRK